MMFKFFSLLGRIKAVYKAVKLVGSNGASFVFQFFTVVIAALKSTEATRPYASSVEKLQTYLLTIRQQVEDKLTQFELQWEQVEPVFTALADFLVPFLHAIGVMKKLKSS